MLQLYKGDLLPKDAWNMLKDKEKTILVDVRTQAEWHYVGVPDLSSINKKLFLIEWRKLPDMAFNEKFENDIRESIKDTNRDIIFICHTGGRSYEAAVATTKLGYKNCYNLQDGFEGSLDAKGHRANINGWKAENLPWRQY